MPQQTRVEKSSFKKYAQLVLWAAGLIALVWGLFQLYTIFVEEKNSAIYELNARKNTLSQYASKAIQLRLQRELQRIENTAAILEVDPLIINDEIFLYKNGKQILPRRIQYSVSDVSAKELYEYIYYVDPLDLLDQQLSPWQARLTLLSHFKLAIDSENADNIRLSFRDIRSQQAREFVDPGKDIPFMVALLDYFLDNSHPENSLVSDAIRSRAITDHENYIPGIQRYFLLHRNRFSKGDFDFFRNKIIAISRAVGVPYDDFVKASELPESQFHLDVAGITEPVFMQNGEWYVEPRQNNQYLGVRIDVSAITQSISREMQQIGLMEAEDTISHNIQNESQMPVNNMNVSVETARWVSTARAIEDHFVLKRTLLLVCAFLALTIAVLASISYFLKQRYLRLKSDFVAAVSHELRTPLASIRLMSETLQRRLAGNEIAKDYPERIVNAVDGLSLLVDNILSYNRLNKGLWKPENRKFNLGELIGEMKNEFRNYAHAPLVINTRDTDKFQLTADFELVRILFRNLISNAYKYNQHSSVEIDITSKSREQQVLLFKDNGVGIPEKNWTNVFNEFQRYVDDREDNVEGAGLGLALCKKIMQLHHGDIRISDSGPKGTTFELVFAT